MGLRLKSSDKLERVNAS